MKNTLVIVAVAGLATAANAQVGVAVAADGMNNFMSETITVAPGYNGNAMIDTWFGGDMFGITSRPTQGAGDGIPFSMLDDSVSFGGDSQGIIRENDLGFFFGVVDTVNSMNTPGTGTAEWTFDITGATGLSVDIDFAAMGDFESSNDTHLFQWSIDGSTPQDLFVGSINEDGDQFYTLADGDVFNLNDPLLINGTTLDNNFQTLSAAIAGSGSTLTISYIGGGDGGTEAFAFRNLTVIPTPGAATLLGVAGLAGLRRRRA